LEVVVKTKPGIAGLCFGARHETMPANEYNKQYQRHGRQLRHIVQLVQGMLLPAGGDVDG